MYLNMVCQKSYNLGVCGGMISKKNFRSHYVIVIDHSRSLYAILMGLRPGGSNSVLIRYSHLQ